MAYSSKPSGDHWATTGVRSQHSTILGRPLGSGLNIQQYSKSEVGTVTNMQSFSNCPCSGHKNCISWQRCERSFYPSGDGTTDRYEWTPHRSCGKCPEYSAGNAPTGG